MAFHGAGIPGVFSLRSGLLEPIQPSCCLQGKSLQPKAPLDFPRSSQDPLHREAIPRQVPSGHSKAGCCSSEPLGFPPQVLALTLTSFFPIHPQVRFFLSRSTTGTQTSLLHLTAPLATTPSPRRRSHLTPDPLAHHPVHTCRLLPRQRLSLPKLQNALLALLLPHTPQGHVRLLTCPPPACRS